MFLSSILHSSVKLVKLGMTIKLPRMMIEWGLSQNKLDMFAFHLSAHTGFSMQQMEILPVCGSWSSGQF